MSFSSDFELVGDLFHFAQRTSLVIRIGDALVKLLLPLYDGFASTSF